MNDEMIDRSNRAYTLHAQASELRAAGQLVEAADKWRTCVELIPDEPAYLREAADCCARLALWEEGLRYAELATMLEPGNAEGWALMAGALGNLGRQEEYKRCLDRADQLAPNSPSVLWNRSLYRLLHGDYAAGWREYEWRFMSNQRRRTLKAPWNGSPIPGRTLFVSAEQGYGDIIQFIRFLRRAKHQSQARVVLEVPRELITLLAGRGAELGFDELVSTIAGGSIPYRDFEHVSLLSLPYVLGINDEREFWDGPYLRSERGGEPQGDLRVGLCWRGSANHSADDVRSIDGETFLKHVYNSTLSIRWYSINPAVRLPDLPGCVNPDLPSFAETIELIAGLDLVITVDTSVAHIAGAMGKPVFLLLRFATDWRWCLNHWTSSPWYPSMRLFRQYALGQWETVLDEVRAHLGNFAGVWRFAVDNSIQPTGMSAHAHPQIEREEVAAHG